MHQDSSRAIAALRGTVPSSHPNRSAESTAIPATVPITDGYPKRKKAVPAIAAATACDDEVTRKFSADAGPCFGALTRSIKRLNRPGSLIHKKLEKIRNEAAPADPDWLMATHASANAVANCVYIIPVIVEGATSSLSRALYNLVFLVFAVLMIWAKRSRDALEVEDRTAKLTAANEELRRQNATREVCAFA
jgi:hypothetical protein